MLARLKHDPHLLRLLIIFLIVAATMSALRPEVFLSWANFRSMSVQFPELGFLSISAALVLMSGGIDLSVTGTATLAGITAALILTGGGGGEPGPIWLAIVAALCVGVGCGLVNALLVSYVGIVPMLATLGTMNLFGGIGIVLTKGSSITKFPTAFLLIGNGDVLGVPIPLILFLIAIVTLGFVLGHTKMGMKLKLYGSNPMAAFYSGVNNRRVVFMTYLCSGVIASLAGIIMISRVNTAKADFGSSYGLQALLVAVLGGVDPSGGNGKASGILLSIITLQFLSSGFNLLHVSSFLKELCWGALLVLIMVMNVVQARRRSKPKKKQAPEQESSE